MQAKFRLGIVLQGGTGWIGGAEYSKNLLKALYCLPEDEAQDLDVVPLAENPVPTELYADMPARFGREIRQGAAKRTNALYRLHSLVMKHLLDRDSSLVPQLANEASVDFLYPYHGRLRVESSLSAAGWIPDFQHKYYPQFFSRKERWARDWGYRRLASRTACVVLSSQVAARDFRTFYPEFANKAQVLSFRTVAQREWANQDCRAICKKYGVPERFLIVCNQFWQHKNHRLVFDALAQLRARAVRPVVVCTGSLRDHRCRPFAEECLGLLRDLNISEQVMLLGLIPREDQIQLLRAALGVIQPSLFEGWSTVVEDARTLGKRLALSNIAVHREQSPPGAEFVDPQSSEQLAVVIERWWAELPSGPDYDREAVALSSSQHQVLLFARQFLRLARQLARPA